MNDILKTILVIIGIYAALRAVTFVMLVYRLLNTRVWPLKLSYEDEERPLSPDQLAAISELEELGFEKISDGLIETGPYAYTIRLYKHKTEPAYAGVTFSLGSGITYPIAFYSFDKSGRILGTTNRLGWSRMQIVAGYEPQDAYATSLLKHWQAHKARLNDIETEDPSLNEVKARLKKLDEDTFPAMLAQKAITKGKEAWHPTLKTAMRLTLAFFKVRQKTCAPYNSKLTSDEHRSSYFTFCYQQMLLIEAGRKARTGVKSWFLVLSALAFYLSFRNYLTWLEGLALVGVVLVHELGHAAAMRAFGYRDITMFFIPFFGAMVTAKPREPIATWKEAIILLAGPLPGLILGLVILSTLPPHQDVSGAFTWRDVGLIAAILNLLNLLPITPLDGGRLLEISVFKRQPYIQHRGGPKGFLRVIGEKTIAFVDYAGNRQYITQGNLAENPKAFLFLIDYARQRRIKIWGDARVVEGDQDLIQGLMPDGYKARPEQVILFTVSAWDANCKQHIPQRFEAAEVAAALAERDKPIAELQAEIRRLRGAPAPAAP